MSNVNDDILQEHINTLAWFNKQNEEPNPYDEGVRGSGKLLLKAANYFFGRMQAAEQAAKNYAEAAKKPPLTDEEKFQKGYVACAEDYVAYLPGGQETLDRLKERWPNE